MHTADATQVLSRIGGEWAYGIRSWRQFRRVWTKLPTASRVASCRRCNAPVGSRRALVANCVHTAPTRTRLNSTVASRRRLRCVLGIM